MSFRGQNPAKQRGDILMYDTHARFKMRMCVDIYHTTYERVKLKCHCAPTLNKTLSGLLTNGGPFSSLPVEVFLVSLEVFGVLSGLGFSDLIRDV